jgi:hypothetical protein
MMTEISYSGYRFPPEIIQQAIWLWWLFAYFVVITIGKLYLSALLRLPWLTPDITTEPQCQHSRWYQHSASGTRRK